MEVFEKILSALEEGSKEKLVGILKGMNEDALVHVLGNIGIELGNISDEDAYQLDELMGELAELLFENREFFFELDAIRQRITQVQISILGERIVKRR